MKTEIKKNTIIIKDCGWNACDVREPREGDAELLAAGRVLSHDLPLSGEWIKKNEYEWGDQRVSCYARWNRHTGEVQVAKAHGSDEDLCLDNLGNLWENHWNPVSKKWDGRIVG